MSMSEDFLAFYHGQWNDMLEGDWEIPGASPHPHGGHATSWDRRAAWLLYNALKGSTEMAPRKKAAKNETAAKLLEVMNFLDVGYKSSGDQQATSTVFYQGWAFSFDGVIAAGAPLHGAISFDGAVDTKLFKEALTRVGKEMELAISENGAVFTSDDFSAIVPTFPLNVFRPVQPDPVMAPFQLGTNFLSAMELAGRSIRDSAENLRDACVVTWGDTVVATNGAILIQVWHGNNMPVGQCVPKAFGNALAKIGREPKSFGFNDTTRTFTVHYEDGSFIRTQTYDPANYPMDRVQQMLEPLLTAPMAVPPPKGLIDAIEKVVPFAGPDGLVWFTGGGVKVGPSDSAEWTAEVEVKDIPEGVGVNGAALLAYKGEIETMWLGSPDAEPLRACIYGKVFRAAIIGAALAVEEPEPEAPAPLAPSTAQWGQGQVSDTPPAPPGWGQPQSAPAAAPMGGVPSFTPPAGQSASETTAPATGAGQWAQPSAGASPSNPTQPAPSEGSASATGQWPMQAPGSAPADPQMGQAAGGATSPSESAPSWAAPAPAAGQEPSLTGAPGWDNVRAAAEGQQQQQPAPSGWGGGTPNWTTSLE
jgi:hypothetical protein